MKKVLGLLILTIALQSCDKKEKETSNEGNSQNRQEEQDTQTPTSCSLRDYYGLGSFDKKGQSIYHISIPIETATSVYKFYFYRVKPDVVFIHLDNNSETALVNSQCNSHRIEFTIPEFKESDTIKQYKIILWHNKGMIDKTKAIEEYEKYLDGLKDDAQLLDTLPKKFGHGVLSIN